MDPKGPFSTSRAVCGPYKGPDPILQFYFATAGVFGPEVQTSLLVQNRIAKLVGKSYLSTFWDESPICNSSEHLERAKPSRNMLATVAKQQ